MKKSLLTFIASVKKLVDVCLKAAIPYDKIPNDPHSIFRARLLAAVLYFGLVSAPIVATLRYMAEGLSTATLMSIVNFSLTFFLLFRFVSKGDMKIVPDIFLLFLACSMLMIIARDGGVYSRTVVWLPALAVTSSFLGHYIRGGAIFLILLVGLFCIYYLQYIGVIDGGGSQSELVGRVVVVMASTFFVIIFASAYERERRIANDSLDEARQKAEAIAKYKSEFLANMSHEIRTPMNGVLGMLNLVARSELDHRQSKQVDLAISSAKSLLTIINDVLDYSKVDAGKLELDLLEFDLPDLIANFSDTMAQRIQEKGLEFILDMQGVNCTMVRADPDRLRQIFTNLVGNAVKFTERGEIIFRLSTEELSNNRIHLSVEVVDTGAGIEKEKLRLIFDSFTQVDASTTRKFGGTGLGLAIVKKLCHLMEGDIRVQSEEEKGSCFSFDVYIQKSPRSEAISEHINAHGRKILIVDDNTSNGEVMSQQLSRWGADCLHVESVMSANALLTRESAVVWNIIFIDEGTTGVDGGNFVNELRKNKDFDSTKVILMTIQASLKNIRSLGLEGIDHSFSKPATLENYIASLSLFGDESTGGLKEVYKNTIEKSEIRPNDPLQEAISQEQDIWPEECRVLLAEDQPINREVMLGFFHELNLANDIAEDGIEVLECLKKTKYSLILMDCQMPNMDGYTATRKIRSGEHGINQCDIPVVALTANAMRGDREKCIESGMDDYLTKPVDEVSLEEKLRQWILGEAHDENHQNQNTQEPETVVDTIWDIDDALKRVRGKEERLKKLVGMFLKAMPERLERVNEQVTTKDTEALASEVHTIKGIAGNLGAIALMNEAATFEQTVKDGEWDKIETQVPTFLEKCKAAEQVLTEYIAAQ